MGTVTCTYLQICHVFHALYGRHEVILYIISHKLIHAHLSPGDDLRDESASSTKDEKSNLWLKHGGFPGYLILSHLV